MINLPEEIPFQELDYKDPVKVHPKTFLLFLRLTWEEINKYKYMIESNGRVLLAEYVFNENRFIFRDFYHENFYYLKDEFSKKSLESM